MDSALGLYVSECIQSMSVGVLGFGFTNRSPNKTLGSFGSFYYMNHKLRRIALGLIIALFVFSIPLLLTGVSASSSDPNVTIYAHRNSSPLDSGLDANTTSLFASTAQTESAGASSSSVFFPSWELYPCLASSITINSGNVVFTVFLTGNGTLSGVSVGVQMIEVATCGSGTQTVLFGGYSYSTISISTTETKFQMNIPVSSQTTIPSGDSIIFGLAINPNTVDTQTITLYYDASASNTNFLLPLSVSPVVVNSLTLSPQSITNPATSLATISVSDAFGVYDIASAKLSASIQGVTPINAQSMNAASGNSPTAYTGSFTTHVNPSATTYSSFSGSWSVTSTVTDQSGNTYNSVPFLLSYSGSSGGCVYCSSTTSTMQGSGGLPSISFGGELLIFAALVLIAVAAVFAVKRR